MYTTRAAGLKIPVGALFSTILAKNTANDVEDKNATRMRQVNEDAKARAKRLEEAIQNYAGCVVVTSHDRWFLDRLATHILAFEGDGYVHWCEGNYETYERQRRERLGINPDEPRRFRYKKLV